MPLTDSSGQAVRLARRIGAGGEGDIHEVAGQSGVAAKRYHQPSAQKAAKLLAMTGRPPAVPREDEHIAICWPQSLLMEDGVVVGFLMPRMDPGDHVPLARLYNPADRRRVAPHIHWGYLLGVAANLASIVAAVHATGHVIGDLNETNLLVSRRGLVTLVDCDSMQVSAPDGVTHRCIVGRPELCAPELSGRDFGETDRTCAHDCFGLAVLIFQLLMEGVHPFAGVWRGGEDDPPLAERIRLKAWPYGGTALASPPPAAPPLSMLPGPLRELTQRCFGDGEPGSRPSAHEWRCALTAAYGALVSCTDNPCHMYAAGQEGCPWCERTAQLGGVDPFPAPVSPARLWLRSRRWPPRGLLRRLAAPLAVLAVIGALALPLLRELSDAGGDTSVKASGEALIAAHRLRARGSLFMPGPLNPDWARALPRLWNGPFTGMSEDGWPLVNGVRLPLTGISEIFDSERTAFSVYLREHGSHLRCQQDAHEPLTYHCSLPGVPDVAIAALSTGAAVGLHCTQEGTRSPDPDGYCRIMRRAISARQGRWSVTGPPGGGIPLFAHPPPTGNPGHCPKTDLTSQAQGWQAADGA